MCLITAGVGDASDEKSETVDPAVYVEHILEEVNLFELEMKKLKGLVTQALPPIGSDEEKRELVRMSENLDSSIVELSKSVEDLKHDVHDVKSLSMEASLWVEDTKSRLRQLSKPRFDLSLSCFHLIN